MKILITGAAGQLGSDSVKVLGRAHTIVARSSQELDIADPGAVATVVRETRPDIVLNCAAFTKVDDCESKQGHAWKVNAQGPKNLAESVERYGGLLVHISTDYVFDGLRAPPKPYVETDAPAPVSCYGKSKLEGEEVVKRTTDRAVIVRTSWVYGITGHNFLKTMLRSALLNPKRTLTVVNDQCGSPTWSHRLARQLERIIEARATGLYHAASENYCTWYELALHFLSTMDVEHNIEPCTTADYPTPAVRPKNSILGNKRLTREGINLMKPWSTDVDEFVATYREELIAEARRGLS
jgi:dTDP-4-dehydrorhamnose reductase